MFFELMDRVRIFQEVFMPKQLNRYFLIVAVLGALLFNFAFTRSAYAQSGVLLTGNSLSDLNIRSGPGLQAGTIGVLPAGEKVTAIGRNTANNWVQIQYGSTTGWVAAWLTVYSGDTVLLPVTSSAVPSTVPIDSLTMISPYNVKIRSQPSISGSIVGKIPHSTEVTVFGRTEFNNWFAVKYNGTTGWVAAWLVLLNDDPNSLPITDLTGSGGNAGTLQPTPTFAPGVPTSTPNPSVTVTPGPTTLPDTGLMAYPSSRANLRSSPSLSGAVIDSLTFSDKGVAVGQNAAGNWIQVNHRGTVGWVARWVVYGSDDFSALPVTASSAEIIAPTGVLYTRNLYEVIIRSGAGTGYGAIGVLSPGAEAVILARTSNSSWLKVRLDQIEGWVAAWLVTANGDFANAPVE
jgi:uncharacterized protein YgiM (DUF1202 family)